ncbi:MAG: serine hydrolase [Bacteroidales bacterium]
MKLFYRFFLFLLVSIEVILIVISIFFDFSKEKEETTETFFLDVNPQWADTMIKNMSIDEKIGQMLVLDLQNASGEDKEIYDSIVNTYKMGGVEFNATTAIDQLILTNYLQSKSKYPLFVASEGSIINQENFNFPTGPIINSAGDNVFTSYYISEFAIVLKLLGVNAEFSCTIQKPDDLNGFKSVSDNDSILNAQNSQFRKKLYRQNIIAGVDFNDNYFYLNDSVLADSIITKNKLLNLDRFFALKLSKRIVNTITSDPKQPSINRYLTTNYNYKGLIFCQLKDSLIRNEFLALFNSGVESFFVKRKPEQVFNLIKKLYTEGKISENEINKRVRRLLLAKNWAGLQKTSFRSAEKSLSQIMDNQRVLLSWKLYESSVCLVKNMNGLLPFQNLLNNKTHIIYTGKRKPVYFEECLNNYIDVSSSPYIKRKFNPSAFSVYRNLIIILDENSESLFADSLFLSDLKKLKNKNLVILCMKNPAGLQKISFASSVLFAYDETVFSQMIAAQVVAGSMEPKGKLPLSYFKMPVKKPLFRKTDRLQYTIPEAAGYNSILLEEVEKLIDSAIMSHATPGCQVLAAKSGKVFYNKSFGSSTYYDSNRVKNSNIYDIASISKIAATTLAAMKLYENGLIKMNDSIKYYLDDTVHCTIKNHQLRSFFLHQTGLPANMPIIQYIRYKNRKVKRFDKYFSDKKDTSYSVQVADKFYLRKDYLDSIRNSLYNLEWDSSKTYNYSDINFNIIYDVIKRKIEGDYAGFLSKSIYEPLQLRTMGFKPLDRFSKSRIIPTQDDKFWRMQLLLGYPHDESAALYGGISGNAGLFSNANDLAIIFQMLLNGGYYSGKKIFAKETVEYFTSEQSDSQRGLGFARSKSGQFGHTGFTGCVVWANPNNKTIFIFLSNSIHPTPLNRKLRSMQIREKCQDLIQQAYEPGSEILKIKDEY